MCTALLFLSPTKTFVPFLIKCGTEVNIGERVRRNDISLVLWQQQPMQKMERLNLLCPLRTASLHSAVEHQTGHMGKRSCVVLAHGEGPAFWDHTVKKSQILRKPAVIGSRQFTELLFKGAYCCSQRSADYIVISWVIALHTYRQPVFFFYSLEYYLAYYWLQIFSMCFITWICLLTNVLLNGKAIIDAQWSSTNWHLSQ